MVASEGFAAFLRDHLAPLEPLHLRRMFGATGLFAQGVMFGIVDDDTLYLRVDDANRAAFAEAGPPLAYAKGDRQVLLSYRPVPDRLLDEPEELLAWARLALAAAHRAPRKRP